MASHPGRELPFDSPCMMDSKDFEDEFDKLGTGQPCDTQLECASLSLNTTNTNSMFMLCGVDHCLMLATDCNMQATSGGCMACGRTAWHLGDSILLS